MKEYYSKRREKLLESMDEGSFAVIGSGIAPMRSLDEAYPFSVDRNFYYLTGIDRENLILLLVKSGGRTTITLFVERYDEYLAKWVGGRISPEEAKNISGIESIKYLDEFDETIANLINRSRYTEFTGYFDLWRYNKDQADSFGIKVADKIRKSHPQVHIRDIYEKITRLRMIKDEKELECIKEAIKATGKAVRAMMSYVKPEMNECELDGLFNFELAKQGINELAFKTIVAGGKRATTLHYSENCEILKDGELVLTDLGCTYNHYSADITRTYPVNGKFTDRQREIYEIVLGAQNIVFENAKPGITIRQLNNMVTEYYNEALEKAGLLKDGKKTGDYYYHNISHLLGLDTHDVSFEYDYPLEKGMVITVEPGLYIEEEAIGIRIEDDILITDGKPLVLSEDIPKKISDVEAQIKLD